MDADLALVAVGLGKAGAVQCTAIVDLAVAIVVEFVSADLAFCPRVDFVLAGTPHLVGVAGAGAGLAGPDVFGVFGAGVARLFGAWDTKGGAALVELIDLSIAVVVDTVTTACFVIFGFGGEGLTIAPFGAIEVRRVAGLVALCALARQDASGDTDAFVALGAAIFSRRSDAPAVDAKPFVIVVVAVTVALAVAPVGVQARGVDAFLAALWWATALQKAADEQGQKCPCEQCEKPLVCDASRGGDFGR